MQFLRTVFWVVLAVLGVIFAFNNGKSVEVILWSDISIITPLWMVALLSFLVGLLPILILHRATRWNLNRKLEAANRNLSETRAVVEPASVPATSGSPAPPTMTR